MISRLDRYVARYFASSWVVSAVFFVGIYGVYDLFSHVDDLFESLDQEDVNALDVVRMYAYQLPSILSRVSPFIMTMAALVTLLRLQRHNEFMAMVLTGRSARRVIAPVLVLSVFVLAGLVWVQEVAAPQVALERDELRWTLLRPGKERILEILKLVDAEGRLFVAHDYVVGRELIGRLDVSYDDALGRNVHVSGSNATWDEAGGGWRLEQGESSVRHARGRTPSGDPELLTEPAYFVATDVRPEELLAESREPFDLAFVDLLDLSQRYPNSRLYRLLRHYHVTFPLTVLLLVLLGIPFVVNLDARQRMRGLGVAILVCLGFLIMDASLRDLGSRGAMQPVLAAWLPVIVAGSLATVLHDTLD